MLLNAASATLLVTTKLCPVKSSLAPALENLVVLISWDPATNLPPAPRSPVPISANFPAPLHYSPTSNLKALERIDKKSFIQAGFF